MGSTSPPAASHGPGVSDSSGGTVTREQRAGWHPSWPQLAPVIVGATVGAVIGLVLFGYPPAQIALPDDDSGRCGQPDDRAVWLASSLQEQELPPDVDLLPDRCGAGLRAWGIPLLPGERERWLNDVAAIVTGPAIDDAIEEGTSQRERLARTITQMDRRIDREERRLEAELAGLAVRSAIGVLEDNVGELNTERVLAAAAELENSREQRAEFADEEVELRANLRYAQQVRDRAKITQPESGVFSVALGTILGGLVASITVAGVRLLMARHNTPPRYQR